MLSSKPVVPRGGPLISIVYKYNARKVLYFIVTDNEVITQEDISCLTKYTYHFTNVSIRPVSRPFVVSNLFDAVNEVDSYKKPRQSDLVLEKSWVTQCGWMRLCTAVVMVMNITNC